MNICRFQSVEGSADRIVSARLQAGTELMDGIVAVCAKHDIKQGYISCCIGSLQKATFYVIKADGTVKTGARYADPMEVKGPIQFVSGQGLICRTEDGEYALHVHGTFSHWKTEDEIRKN